MTIDAEASTLVAATVVKNAKPLAWLVTSAAKFDQYRIMREASSTASTTYASTVIT